MKKIVVCFICLIFMLAFTGCSVAPGEPTFTGRKPWQFIETSKDNTEYMEFSATRYSYNGLDPTEQAKGKLNFSIVETAGTTELKTSLALTFNEASGYNGKINTVDSTVVFSSSNLSPISSLKTLKRTAEPIEKGYTAQTDYPNLKSTVTLLDGNSKEFKLKSGDYFDNEQLYHVIRSIPELIANASYTFKIATPYDMYASNKYFIHKIKVTVGGTLVKLNVPKAIFDMAIPRSGEDPGKLNDSGEYSIDCIPLQIELSADKSGPVFHMYLSDLKFIDNEDIRAKESNHAHTYTSKVPVKITVEEYSVNSARTHANEYNLQSYSTL